MLDRMKRLTEGVLELCDPDTPAWAQARLSELMAAAGVVPMPAKGQPHPQFHDDVGETEAADIPAGPAPTTITS